MRWRALVGSSSGIVGSLIVVLFLLTAILAPYLAPRNPYAQNLRTTLRAPGRDGYLLGSDELGRDTLSRIIYGSRVSLGTGLAAVAFGVLGGIPMGVTAGFYRGRVDTVLMRLADVLLAFPRILLAIVIVAMYGVGFGTLVVAIGFPDVPIFARLARTSTLVVTQLDYVFAARAIGAGDMRVMARCILPNLIGPMTVQTTFSMASAILIAGGLSFLGFGVHPPTPEWGSMLAQARTYMRLAPHLVLFPGITLAIVVLGVNLLGDAFRQAYDPRFRGRDV